LFILRRHPHSHRSRLYQKKTLGAEYVQPNAAGPATIDGIHYEYVATIGRETHIVDGFDKLKLGQSREEVRKLLGLPDIGRPVYTKDNHGPRYWEYIYRIRYRDKTSWNINDLSVELFFMPNGKLVWAVPHGIPELDMIGGVVEVGGRRNLDPTFPLYFQTIDTSSPH
jgi:hypothetical protein